MKGASEKLQICRPLILLSGLQGVGKTTLGSYLAKTYQYEWIDLDDEVVRHMKYQGTVRQLFCSIGENNFRQIEKEVFLKTLRNQVVDTSILHPCCISLGGGAAHVFSGLDEVSIDHYMSIYLFENQESFCRRMISLYGEVQFHDIPGWLQASMSDCTSFHSIDTVQKKNLLYEALSRIWCERDADMRRNATHIIPVDGLDPKWIVETIVRRQ